MALRLRCACAATAKKNAKDTGCWWYKTLRQVYTSKSISWQNNTISFLLPAATSPGKRSPRAFTMLWLSFFPPARCSPWLALCLCCHGKKKRQKIPVAGGTKRLDRCTQKAWCCPTEPSSPTKFKFKQRSPHWLCCTCTVLCWVPHGVHYCLTQKTRRCRRAPRNLNWAAFPHILLYIFLRITYGTGGLTARTLLPHTKTNKLTYIYFINLIKIKIK